MIQHLDSSKRRIKMKAYIKSFTYPDSKTGLPKERSLYVLNEDENRLGGIDLFNVDEDGLKTLTEMFKEKEISDFSKKPKDPLAPKVEYPKIGVYKAFLKNKIL